LNVFPVEMPPLRERVEDIPLLVEVFLKKLKNFSPKKIHDVHPRVMEAFKNYAWPGNIRELENLMERAYILETSPILTPASFPGELFEFQDPVGNAALVSGLTLADARRRGIEDIEIRYLRDLLTRYSGKIGESAKVAGISTRQLHKLMKRYGIRKEDFKSLSRSAA
jgi:DNA-binding NtrC family response regulator